VLKEKNVPLSQGINAIYSLFLKIYTWNREDFLFSWISMYREITILTALASLVFLGIL